MTRRTRGAANRTNAKIIQYISFSILVRALSVSHLVPSHFTDHANDRSYNDNEDVISGGTPAPGRGPLLARRSTAPGPLATSLRSVGCAVALKAEAASSTPLGRRRVRCCHQPAPRPLTARHTARDQKSPPHSKPVGAGAPGPDPPSGAAGASAESPSVSVAAAESAAGACRSTTLYSSGSVSSSAAAPSAVERHMLERPWSESGRIGLQP